MAYRKQIEITPSTITNLTVVVKDNTFFATLTLDDFTLDGNVLIGDLTVSDNNAPISIYSQGYEPIITTFGDLSNSITLTPTSDYIKTSDGTNDYYVKDKYSRQFGNDLLDILSTKADSSDIPAAVTESTVSGWGFTKNVGTVTSVNNTQPVNGNVTISIPDTSNLANKDLSNLSTTGNTKFQTPLVSGTNIKTVNNTSLLGSGNVAVQPTLVSGTNIKTINGNSLLGSGDVSVADTDLSNLSTAGQNIADTTLDQNTNARLKYWTGTQSEYSSLNEIYKAKDSNLGENQWRAIAYDGTKFVALSRIGYISTSIDGFIWNTATQNTDLGSLNWQSIAYGGTKFVALSYYGDISTSTDGATWTPTIQNTNLGSHNWRALTYGNSKFVALGLHGDISTSINGTTWAAPVRNTNLGNNNWQAITYDGTKFVAIDYRGYVSTSTDGTTWTTAVQNSNLGENSWQAITYDGTKFVALSSTGYISTSTNGTTWTTAVQNTDLGENSWQTLVYGDTKLIALGLIGHIYINSLNDNTLYVCTDTGNIYKGAIILSANNTLSNVSSIDSGSAVATALDAKVNTSDIWYDNTSSTLYIGVPQS